MRHDRELYLDLLRERAALMDIPDDQVRQIYARLDQLPPYELRRILEGDVTAELKQL